MRFHMWWGLSMWVFLRDRRSIWWGWIVTPVAPRIVNDLNLVTIGTTWHDIKSHSQMHYMRYRSCVFATCGFAARVCHGVQPLVCFCCVGLWFICILLWICSWLPIFSNVHVLAAHWRYSKDRKTWMPHPCFSGWTGWLCCSVSAGW